MPLFVEESSGCYRYTGHGEAELNSATLAELQELTHVAASFARPEVSHFSVGAAALGASGRVWLGANMEFPGAVPFNFTVHAEQAATTNARQHGEKAIRCLAVTAAPCGYCRQYLLELRSPLPILIGDELTSLDALLPMAFCLELEDPGFTLLSTPSFPAVAAGGSGHSLADAAWAEALNSYAPYSNYPSGVALRCASGKVFTGPLLESCAYNPSLTAMQTALIVRNMAGAHDDTIIEAVLSERSSAPLSQYPAFQMMLKALYPQAICRRDVRE